MNQRRSYRSVWLALLVFQVISLGVALPRLVRFGGRTNPRAAFWIIVAATLLYALFLLAIRAYARSVPAARAKVRGIGIALVIVGLLWLVSSIAAVLDETQSMAWGLLSIAGMVCWVPVCGVGLTLYLVSRREP